MEKYHVCVHEVLEREVIYSVEANSEEEAEEFVIEGNYDEIVSVDEFGMMEDPDIISINKV